MAEFILSPEAEADLDEIHAWIATENPDAANRVLVAAHDSFRKLAQRPALGHLRSVTNPELEGLRPWAVGRLRNHLIFYRPMMAGAGVEIVRVLHGARDLPAVLGE